MLITCDHQRLKNLYRVTSSCALPWQWSRKCALRPCRGCAAGYCIPLLKSYPYSEEMNQVMTGNRVRSKQNDNVKGWVTVTLCSPLEICQSFRGFYYLHLQGGSVFYPEHGFLLHRSEVLGGFLCALKLTFFQTESKTANVKVTHTNIWQQTLNYLKGQICVDCT
jgi:hypothetical protein